AGNMVSQLGSTADILPPPSNITDGDHQCRHGGRIIYVEPNNAEAMADRGGANSSLFQRRMGGMSSIHQTGRMDCRPQSSPRDFHVGDLGPEGAGSGPACL